MRKDELRAWEIGFGDILFFAVSLGIIFIAGAFFLGSFQTLLSDFVGFVSAVL